MPPVENRARYRGVSMEFQAPWEEMRRIIDDVAAGLLAFCLEAVVMTRAQPRFELHSHVRARSHGRDGRNSYVFFRSAKADFKGSGYPTIAIVYDGGDEFWLTITSFGLPLGSHVKLIGNGFGW
jgi:hypothetical protein